MDERDDWDIMSEVGITALRIAAARATESERRDALIEDRYAEGFVARAATAIPVPPKWVSVIGSGDWSETDERWASLWAAMVSYVGVRSRFFDEFCLDACSAGVRQVAILATGLDARAFRLSWPPRVELFELDMPKVLEFKDSVLAEQEAVASCVRHVVPIDLRADWPNALLRAGFDPRRATAWLAEGLLPYLPGAAVEALFANVHRLSAPGSQLAAEVAHPDERAMFHDPTFLEFQHDMGMNMAAWLLEDNGPDPVRWFREHDWQVTTTSAAKAADRYRRRLDEPIVALVGKYILFSARRD